MWFNIFDTVTIYSEEMFDSPMPQHVISTVCSKLKGHNGDPCIVFFMRSYRIKKWKKLMSDNYFSSNNINSNNINQCNII